MATPNGLNPTFGGRVGAQGFATLHNKGIGCVVVDTNSTTAVDVFGTTNGFTGTITTSNTSPQHEKYRCPLSTQSEISGDHCSLG